MSQIEDVVWHWLILLKSWLMKLS